jgi:adenylate kinase
MNIILLGAPGAGKGTLAQSLINEYSFVQISTGDLIREMVKKEGELADQLRKIMQGGGLVDDEIVKKLIS